MTEFLYSLSLAVVQKNRKIWVSFANTRHGGTFKIIRAGITGVHQIKQVQPVRRYRYIHHSRMYFVCCWMVLANLGQY